MIVQLLQRLHSKKNAEYILLGLTGTKKMKRPPLWGLMLIDAILLIGINYIFVQDMHWNVFVTLFFITVQIIFLASYWLLYAHSKIPSKAAIYLLIWCVLGALSHFLQGTPTPLEIYLLFRFPFSSAFIILHLAISKQKLIEKS